MPSQPVCKLQNFLIEGLKESYYLIPSTLLLKKSSMLDFLISHLSCLCRQACISNRFPEGPYFIRSKKSGCEVIFGCKARKVAKSGNETIKNKGIAKAWKLRKPKSFEFMRPTQSLSNYANWCDIWIYRDQLDYRQKKRTNSDFFQNISKFTFLFEFSYNII